MASRYDNVPVGINDLPQYKQLFKERNVKFIKQFFTPTIYHPTEDEIKNLKVQNHIWGINDRMYKLANKHYGDAKLWWIIAWFNLKPTDAHIKLGDVIYIPSPVEDVLKIFKV